MPVGENGGNLSAGQKQSVAIARLLLADPKVIFLDEPSGAMDLASERHLIACLRQAIAPDVTLVLSTHRYSMLDLIDRLIVIENGKLIADGPKEQVIAALQRKNQWGSVMRTVEHDTPPLVSRYIVGICLFSVMAFLVWAAWAEVDEISRGDGKVIPLSKTQIVQASEAGVVEEIAVSVGEVVKKGDLLIRLDSSVNLASLGESQARYDALQARIARLQLEIDGLFETDFVCPERTRRVSESICENESRLLAARRENYRNKLQVLEARRQQRRDEIGEARSNVDQTGLVIQAMLNERDKIEPLVKRKLHPEIDLLRLDREIAQQNGQRENVSQSLKRLDSALREAELQVQELDSQFKQEARRELGDTLADASVLQATFDRCRGPGPSHRHHLAGRWGGQHAGSQHHRRVPSARIRRRRRCAGHRHAAGRGAAFTARRGLRAARAEGAGQADCL